VVWREIHVKIAQKKLNWKIRWKMSLVLDDDDSKKEQKKEKPSPSRNKTVIFLFVLDHGASGRHYSRQGSPMSAQHNPFEEDLVNKKSKITNYEYIYDNSGSGILIHCKSN